ncbi:MAG: NUDIX hydrolase [Clostridiales bacterium]|nr:NUDIX hydrolase [Clostridiales bacterium]
MKRLSRNEIYSGRVIDVFYDDVELANGTKTIREVVAHKEGAAIVAVNDKQEVILVKQFRYPVDKNMVELPAGLIDEGESPLEAAKRELKEETGYIAREWELLTSTYSSPGWQDERIHIYAARGLEHVAEQDLDKDEELIFYKESIKDVLKKVNSGEITDAKTIIGILMYWSRYSL